MANELGFFWADFCPFPLSYGADNVSLAQLLKARLCFEHASFLNAKGQIIGYLVGFR